MIERSKDAPLSLTYFECHKQGQQKRELLFTILEVEPKRLRTLTLNSTFQAPLFSPYRSGGSILKVISPSHILKKLVICGSFRYEDSVAIHEIQPLMGSPALTHLEIIRCHLLWDTIPYSPNIRILKLQNDSRNRPPSLDGFLRSLAALPRLEVLQLGNMLPVVHQGEREAGEAFKLKPTIPLASTLRSLTIIDSLETITAFLLAVEVTNEILVDLRFAQRPGLKLEDVTKSVAAYQGLRRRTQAGGLTDKSTPSHMTRLDFKFFKWKLCNARCWFGNPSLNDQPSLTLSADASDLFLIFQAIFEEIGLEHVKDLTIRGGPLPDEASIAGWKRGEEWTNIIQSFNGLEYLTLDETTVDFFPFHKLAHHEAPGPTLCPRLHTLSFHGVPPGDLQDIQPGIERILDVLRSLQGNCPVKKVQIKDLLGFSEKEYEELCAGLGEVEWDGRIRDKSA